MSAPPRASPRRHRSIGAAGATLTVLAVVVAATIGLPAATAAASYPSPGGGVPPAGGAVLVPVASAPVPAPCRGGTLASACRPTDAASPDPDSSGWANLTPSVGAPPPTSAGAASAYDPTSGTALWFGGLTPSFVPTNATVEFVDGRWGVLNLTQAPPPLLDPAMVWDPVDHYFVLFGGANVSSGVYSNQTWTFNGVAWSELHPLVAPPPNCQAAFAWDSTDGYAVLFGGATQGAGPLGYANTTWTFVGGQWTNRTAGVAPPARLSPGLSDDPAMGGLVLFGGQGTEFGWEDTWQYARGVWTQLVQRTVPPAREGMVFAYDAPLGAPLLWGGCETSGSYGEESDLEAAWTLTAAGWTGVSVSAHPLDVCTGDGVGGGVFDAAVGGFLIYDEATTDGQGGTPMDETWVLYTLQPSIVPTPAAWEGAASGDLSVTTTPDWVAFSVNWSFGDGTFATGATVQHHYATAGSYWVSATVTDAQGVANRATTVVTQYAPVQLLTSVSPLEGPAPLTVGAAASAVGGLAPYSFTWARAAGAAVGAAASFTFATPGTYTLAATVVDATGASSATNFSVVVAPASPPSAPAPFSLGIASNASSGSAPLFVGLSPEVVGGVAPFQFAWIVGTDLTSAAPTLNATLPTAGPVIVRLEAIDAAGVEEWAERSIDVTPALAVTAEGAPASATAPLEWSFHATATGGAPPFAFRWSFGDGGTATSANATHAYAAPGPYAVVVGVTDAAGRHTAQRLSVEVTSGPPAASGPSVARPGAVPSAATGAGLAVGAAGAALALVGIVAFRQKGQRPDRPGARGSPRPAGRAPGPAPRTLRGPSPGPRARRAGTDR